MKINYSFALNDRIFSEDANLPELRTDEKQIFLTNDHENCDKKADYALASALRAALVIQR